MKRLKAVIFDLDGTIIDVPYDWRQIKEELGTEGKPILFYLAGLKEPEKSEKWKLLEKHEEEATSKAALKKGILQLLDLLAERRIKKVLVTNNSRKNVTYLLGKFKLDFDFIISRESGLWKPSGAPFLAVLRELKIAREECCVVGDSAFDLKAAEEAGISQVLILSRNKKNFSYPTAEVFESVESLKQRIKEVLKNQNSKLKTKGQERIKE